jgi:LAGLIDADG endonuclease
MEDYSDNNDSVLNPNFITDLSDAEGCFSVHVSKDKRAKLTRNVKLEFTIKMLENEIELLFMVRSFFQLWHFMTLP